MTCFIPLFLPSFCDMAWQAKSLVITGQLWLTGPGLRFSAIAEPFSFPEEQVSVVDF